MADEKRRLIYELLVEAKGANKAKAELDSFSKQLVDVGGVAKGVFGIFAAGFALKGIGEALDEMTKFKAAMGTLGVSGESASAALQSVQDVAFKTGTAISGVTEVYKEAVQLQGQLGRSAEEAARTTDAFIRIANAEGKTAAQAAESVQTLAFALESGVLPAKQFTALLRDSPTFAKAAQEALGKTTEQLVEMAKQGDIGREALTGIVLALENIGSKTETSVTVMGVVDSLKALVAVMITATAEGANFNAQLTGGQSGWQEFIDSIRGFFQFIGGGIAVVSNLVQMLYDFATFIPRVVMNLGDIGKSWGQVNQAIEDDLVDMGRGFMTMWERLTGGFRETAEQVSEISEAAEQASKDAATKLLAKNKEFQEKLGKAFGDSWDAYIKKHEKDMADLALARIKAAEEAAQAEINAYVEELEAKGRLDRAYQKMLADMEKDRIKEMDEFKKQAAEDLQKEIDAMPAPEIGGLTKQFFQDIDAATEAAFLLKDTFADLFTGGIRNARQFFQVILSGLAQVFAQIAAQKLAQGIMDALLGGGGLGAFGKAAMGAGVSAKGNAFQDGHRVALAQGGVVHGPTVFPMAHGATGLMGEAGPEAVLPLKRMSSGKLGVAAGMPSVQIINKLGVMAQGRVEKQGDRMAIILEAAKLGASMAEDRFNRSVRTGYGTVAQSVQSTYGLRRKV